MTVLHTPPSQYGQAQSRWTLATLRASCPWLQLSTDGGLCQLLARLTIRRKRARAYLHSPDPDYAAKVAYLDQCRQQLSAAPERRVLVYLDEVAFERQPTKPRARAARWPTSATVATRAVADWEPSTPRPARCIIFSGTR